MLKKRKCENIKPWQLPIGHNHRRTVFFHLVDSVLSTCLPANIINITQNRRGGKQSFPPSWLGPAHKSPVNIVSCRPWLNIQQSLVTLLYALSEYRETNVINSVIVYFNLFFIYCFTLNGSQTLPFQCVP